MRCPATDEAKRKIEAKINAAHWTHRFEILPGIVTPGAWDKQDPADILDRHYLFGDLDFAGLRVLDIGALDGMFAFEFEKRGASVVAFDIQDPDRTAFNTAKSVLGSKVEYVQGSVYDLDRHFSEQFDIVCYFAVWNHVKNPISAFDQIASRLKDTGILLAEGSILIEYMEGPNETPESHRQLAGRIGNSEVALTAYYPDGVSGDPWSWFVPNIACVKAWLRTSGMAAVHQSIWNDYPHQRIHVTARKDPDIRMLVDNPVW